MLYIGALKASVLICIATHRSSLASTQQRLSLQTCSLSNIPLKSPNLAAILECN